MSVLVTTLDEIRIRKLKEELIYLQAIAAATLGDMEGKSVLEQLAIAKDTLSRIQKDFDPNPTPEELKKWGLGLQVVSKEDETDV